MVAIELVGLNSDELAELVCETNIAANRRDPEVAETGETSA